MAAHRAELLLSDRDLRLHPVAADHPQRVDAQQHGTGRYARHSAITSGPLPGCSCSLLSDCTGKRKLFVCLPLIGFALHVPFRGAENNVWLACRAGRLRLLPAIGSGRVLDHSGAFVQWVMAGGARESSNALATSAASAVLMRGRHYSSPCIAKMGFYCLAISLALAALMALLLPAKCDAGAAPLKTLNPHKRTA